MHRSVLAGLAFLPALILLLPVFVIAGALLLVSSTVRALARRLEPDYVAWHDLMVFDATLGWKPRPGLDAHYLATGDDVYRVVTDREGWPGRQSIEGSQVVVIGDSFAFGYGIDAGRSFAERNPSLAIKPIGAPGYSMVQGVLLMEQLRDRLSGKLVVWFICLENDLQDAVSPSVWRYRTPFIRRSGARGEWEIVTDHVVPTVWQSPDWSWKRLFPHLCVPGPIADRVYEGCGDLIRRAADACARANAQLVLVTIPELRQLTEAGRSTLAELSGRPDAFDANLPDKQLAESCRQYGVPIVVGKDHLSPRHYKPREGLHWTEDGHRRMAALLVQLHDSFVCGGLAAPAVGKTRSVRDIAAAVNVLVTTSLD